MKYLKRFEQLKMNKYKSITEDEDCIYCDPYELSNEMKYDENVTNVKEFYDLCNMLFVGKIGSYFCDDCNEIHKGLIKKLEFEGGFYRPEKKEKGFEELEYIFINMQGYNSIWDSHAIGDNPKTGKRTITIYKVETNANKYNL